MAKGSGFKFQKGQDFSPLHIIQTSSRAHPASYPMDARVSFPEEKAAGA
jgi:hypothetical protein